MVSITPVHFDLLEIFCAPEPTDSSRKENSKNHSRKKSKDHQMTPAKEKSQGTISLRKIHQAQNQNFKEQPDDFSQNIKIITVHQVTSAREKT